MAASKHNVLQFRRDPFEAMAGPEAKGLHTFQPLGLINGKSFGMPNSDLYDIGRNFILTEVGTGTVPTVTLGTATLPPHVKFITGATQHDNQQLQWARALTSSATAAGSVTAIAPFVAKAGYNIHFGVEYMTSSTATLPAIFAGLVPVDTTVLASSAIGNNDAIGLYKVGAADTNAIIRAGGTSTTVDLSSGTTVINTWHSFEFLLEGRTTCSFWFDGVRTGESTMTNLPANTVTLCPTLAVSATTGAAVTVNFRRFYCYQEAV